MFSLCQVGGGYSENRHLPYKVNGVRGAQCLAQTHNNDLESMVHLQSPHPLQTSGLPHLSSFHKEVPVGGEDIYCQSSGHTTPFSSYRRGQVQGDGLG